MRGATCSRQSGIHRAENFNPRSPCGERRHSSANRINHSRFQSTLPMRGATLFLLPFGLGIKYFNPRSPCGERRGVSFPRSNIPVISIHAPHAGSDVENSIRSSLPSDFNPRSPCGERRLHDLPPSHSHNFNPRSPCGERRGNPPGRIAERRFQSTLPMRGATTSKQP